MKEKKGHAELNSRGDAAVALMAAGGNCAQAVLLAFAADLGLEEETALRIAAGFGAGLGRNQEVCGAVTGGVLAIGLKHGAAGVDDPRAKEPVYRLTRELMARFRARFGSCLCRELLRVDLLTAEGQQRYKERGLGERVCRPCVRGAVGILEEILPGGAEQGAPTRES